MIDVFNEDLLDPKEVAQLAPFRRNGKPAHVALIYRAIQRGYRAVNGERVKLESVKTPAGLRTSKQAIERWLRKLTLGDGAPVVDATAEHARAEAALDLAGI